MELDVVSNMSNEFAQSLLVNTVEFNVLWYKKAETLFHTFVKKCPDKVVR